MTGTENFLEKMSEKIYKVKVVIPIYSDGMSEQERMSIRNNAAVLNRYPIVLVMPHGISGDEALRQIPAGDTCEVVRVSDEWLGRRNGVAGYNRMMLSAEFYDMFSDTEYILLCQTDAWIFRDELEQWCDEGYDYVGAPWIKRVIYDKPVIRHYLALRRMMFSGGLKLLRQSCFNKIGNGGLSLRRVESFRKACRAYRSQIEYFAERRHHLYNEDVFWALMPEGFRYPTVRRALDFSFDTNPAYCYKLTDGRLPFSCHAWSKSRYYKFWQPFIEAHK